MENVVINIPSGSLTQSGEFSLEIKETNRLFALVACGAANFIQKYRVDAHNIFIESAIPVIAYEGHLIGIDSSFISYLSKRSNTPNFENIFLDYGTDAFSSVTFTSFANSKKEISGKVDVKRYDTLVTTFNEEVKKYGHYILVDYSTAFALFKKMATQLAKIHFKDCVVELTPSNSFKTKLLLPDDRLLVVTKPFSEIDDLESNEVIFGIFENKKCLISDAKDIVKLVKGVNDYLDSK